MINSFFNAANTIYINLESSLPANLFFGVNMFFLALIIAFIAFVIWKFYNALTRKNFIRLNLRKYDWSEHPVMKKFKAVIFYFIEYIVLMPILILIWFTIFSIVLLLLGAEREAIQLLLLSGAMVLAIRILAYYNEEISKELAKLFPFIALSVFLLTPRALGSVSFLESLKQIPLLFDNILYFLVVIFSVEIVLRVVYTLYELATGKEEVGDKD